MSQTPCAFGLPTLSSQHLAKPAGQRSASAHRHWSTPGVGRCCSPTTWRRLISDRVVVRWRADARRSGAGVATIWSLLSLRAAYGGRGVEGQPCLDGVLTQRENRRALFCGRPDPHQFRNSVWEVAMTRAWRFVVVALMAVTMTQFGGSPPALAAVPIEVTDGPHVGLGEDFPELNVGVTIYARVVCEPTAADGDAVFSASMTQVVKGKRTTATSDSHTVNAPSRAVFGTGLTLRRERLSRPGRATFTSLFLIAPSVVLPR